MYILKPEIKNISGVSGKPVSFSLTGKSARSFVRSFVLSASAMLLSFVRRLLCTYVTRASIHWEKRKGRVGSERAGGGGGGLSYVAS